MKLRRPRATVLSAAVLVALAYAFLAGPLFAWSPIKPGYQAIHRNRVSVYFGARTTLPAATPISIATSVARRSVLAWSIDAVDHEHFDWPACGTEFQPQLLF